MSTNPDAPTPEADACRTTNPAPFLARSKQVCKETGIMGESADSPRSPPVPDPHIEQVLRSPAEGCVLCILWGVLNRVEGDFLRADGLSGRAQEKSRRDCRG